MQIEPNFNAKLPKVTLLPREEQFYNAMKDEGFLDGGMLTLAGPLQNSTPWRHASKDWLERSFHKATVAYWKNFRKKIQYRMVSNRGYLGTGEWSAHVVWKNEAPEHVDWLVSWWNKKYGVDRAKLSAHMQSLRYWVRNMAQPEAYTKDGSHNQKAKVYTGKHRKES